MMSPAAVADGYDVAQMGTGRTAGDWQLQLQEPFDQPRCERLEMLLDAADADRRDQLKRGLRYPRAEVVVVAQVEPACARCVRQMLALVARGLSGIHPQIHPVSSDVRGNQRL